MPNQPAPPAPTPTMAEAIAFMEARLRGLYGPAHDHSIDCIRLALSAMRAVEAGPVWVQVLDGAGNVWYPAVDSVSEAEAEVKRLGKEYPERNPFSVRALYAFPSPDGGSAE